MTNAVDKDRRRFTSKLRQAASYALGQIVRSGPGRDLLNIMPTATQHSARRSLAVLDVGIRKCDLCEHFNLDEGQRSMAEDSKFAMIASVLTPDQMSSLELDEQAGDREGATPASIRTKLGAGVPHSWSGYGACALHGALTHKKSNCENWQ